MIDNDPKQRNLGASFTRAPCLDVATHNSQPPLPGSLWTGNLGKAFMCLAVSPCPVWGWASRQRLTMPQNPSALSVCCSLGRDNGTDPKPAPRQSQVFPLSSVGVWIRPKACKQFSTKSSRHLCQSLAKREGINPASAASDARRVLRVSPQYIYTHTDCLGSSWITWQLAMGRLLPACSQHRPQQIFAQRELGGSARCLEKAFPRAVTPAWVWGRSRAAAQSDWGSIHPWGCSRKVSLGEMLLPLGSFGLCALQGGRSAGGIQEPTTAEGSQQPLARVPAVF